MKIYNVTVAVEVQVRLHDRHDLREAANMALEASSHNRNSPNKSSVLEIPGYGEAEVVKQAISYARWKEGVK